MNRVAITGLGAISAIGNSPSEIFEAALAGKSGVRVATDLAFGSTIPLVASANFDSATIVSKRHSVPMDRATAMALAAARQAVADAGSALDNSSHRIGIFWGTGMGGAGTIEGCYRSIFQHNNWRLRPTSVVTGMNNAPAALISLEFGITGPSLTFSVACASSAIAVGEGMRAVRHGLVDVAIVGGSESLLTQGVLAAWSALRALASHDRECPARSCKPFAANRCGFVLGEGSAALILENADRAAQRRARVYAELSGYALTSDSTHIADPSAEGQTRAIIDALKDANLAPSQIGYINAHGTATIIGDRVEVESIKRAFGSAAPRVPVSSTKALHGHAMGATGAIEFMISVLSLVHGALPPTAHLAQPDPGLDLDFLRDGARRGQTLSSVMSNSFAFGGSNAVLVATRSPDRPHPNGR